MKQLVVLSGKGGTGKTSVTAAFVDIASRHSQLVIADADVDAANLELVIEPTLLETHEFVGSQAAHINQDLCTSCGRCLGVCRFDAILLSDDVYSVDPLGCEGCASCHYQCPAGAIDMVDCHTGQWYLSESRFGTLFHAQLAAAQESSGKLVSMLKQQSALWALDHGDDYLLIDGPPGIGCPVIAACAGADLALIVVEPTISGRHDMERVLQLSGHFGLQPAVLVNKADINPETAAAIVAYCAQLDVPVVGQVPFDPVVTRAMVQGLPVTAVENDTVTPQLTRAWQAVKSLLDGD